MQEALDRIEDFIGSGGTHQVATANVDYLVNATRDLEYRRILCMCDLVLPDGMPIVWASHLFGAPLRERVTGADLVPQLARLSSEKGYTIFLLGATPAVSAAAASRLEALSPGVKIAGSFSPPIRPLEEFDNAPILEAIERAKPDILLVAFGSPKQEKWISRNCHLLKVPVTVGIGGSLEFLARSVKRAPAWMQNNSLEWLHRMWKEPRRLGPRYLSDAIWIARYLPLELLISLVGRPWYRGLRLSFRSLRLSMDAIDTVPIVRVGGAMTGLALARLGRILSAAVASGGPVILDLSETSHIGADGLWTLARSLRRASERGCELWLTGLSPSLTRTLRVAHFEGLIRSAVSALDAVRQISLSRVRIKPEPEGSWAMSGIAGDIPNPRSSRATA
jgi:N-acetylglucosaminyldiphosphoundecaprenol N-acetyl-beta-D-mannosaminyltransferase